MIPGDCNPSLNTPLWMKVQAHPLNNNVEKNYFYGNKKEYQDYDPEIDLHMNRAEEYNIEDSYRELL